MSDFLETAIEFWWAGQHTDSARAAREVAKLKAENLEKEKKGRKSA